MGDIFSRPKVTPPARMPDVNDPAIKAAEERQRQAILSRSGRSSTILTPRSNSGSGGSQAYGNTVLGDS